MTYLVEKVNRRDKISFPVHIFAIIFAITYLSEISNVQLSEEQDKLSETRKKALLGSESQ